MTAPFTLASSATRRHPEYDIHLAVLAYLRLVLPGAVIHHSGGAPETGNGVNRSIGRAVAKAKHMGRRDGFADLFVLYAGQALFFEVKAPGGYPSEAQRLFRGDALLNGGNYAVVRSVDEVRHMLAAWGVETREKG